VGNTPVDCDLLRKKDQKVNDCVINGAMACLKQQYPDCGGLQDTQNLINPKQCKVQKTAGVQILNLHNAHWVTVYRSAPPENQRSTRKQPGHCLDSARVSGVDNAVKNLTRQFWPDLKTVINEPCQQQKGATDCGLFAIAFCESIARTGHPPTSTLDQKKMREHLIQCFRGGNLTPFPVKKTTTKKRSRHG
jgi:hypothetical protein